MRRAFGGDANPNENNHNHNNNEAANRAPRNNNNNNNGPRGGGIPFAFPGGRGQAQFGFGAIPVPVVDPGELLAGGNHGGTKPKWSLSKLQRVLLATSNGSCMSRQATTLVVDTLEGYWSFLEKEDWRQACQAWAQALPNVACLQIHHAEHLQDWKWAELLHHFPNITSLTFRCVGTMVETCQRIGELKQLECLALMDDRSARSSGRGISPECCEALAKSLRKLRKLSKLTLANLIVQQVGPCWGPLLKAIRDIPTIAELDINGGWHQRPIAPFAGAPRICQGITLSANNMEKVQYGPRICEAKKKYLTKINPEDGSEMEPSLEDWVNAIISVRDRMDCLHYLMSESDPNMFAVPALEAALAKGHREQAVAEIDMEIVD